MDDLIPSRIVINTDIPPTLVFTSREIDIIQPSSSSFERTIEATEDEEELEDDS